MARGLYARVAARGFKSPVADGLTGAGALDSQGHPVDPAHGQNTSGDIAQQTLTGFAPEEALPPQTEILLGHWGLPGATLPPDSTPGSHAAPVPGWAGSYAPSEDLELMHEKSAAIHAADFGALARHTSVQGIPEPQLDQWSSNFAGENVLEPVRGQLQAMGGYDTTQGYDRRNGYGFDAGHRSRTVATDPQPMYYLDPSERLFITPQVNSTFFPTDAVQGPAPVGTYLDAGNVNPTPPSDYAPPAEPETLSRPQQGGAVSAGWWG